MNRNLRRELARIISRGPRRTLKVARVGRDELGEPVTLPPAGPRGDVGRANGRTARAHARRLLLPAQRRMLRATARPTFVGGMPCTTLFPGLAAYGLASPPTKLPRWVAP